MSCLFHCRELLPAYAILLMDKGTLGLDAKKHAAAQKHLKVLDVYLRRLIELGKETKKTDPLQFWRANGKDMPILSRIVRRIFPMPVTSIEAHRVTGGTDHHSVSHTSQACERRTSDHPRLPPAQRPSCHRAGA